MMGSTQEIARFFGTVNLFAGMESAELEEVAGVVRPFERSRGDTLFRQGEASDGMYIIRRGTVEIRSRVPGDSATTLAQLEVGDLLGEVSLLDRGLRSATAVAVKRTAGYWLGRRHFELLRHDMKPASLTLMRRLIANTCASLRRSYARIESLAHSPDGSATPNGSDARLTSGDASAIPFGSLPFFRRLAPEERRRILDAGRVVQAERGAPLYLQGQDAQEVFIVLRGAARTVLGRTAPRFPVTVLAPGCVAGLVGALDGGRYGTSGFAAEASLFLCIARSTLEELQSEPLPRAWYLTEHLHENLVRVLRRCTDHASRLELQRSLSAAPYGESDV
jgi:CRP/FNR family cyclic AMP-dependent transcriptional regulator